MAEVKKYASMDPEDMKEGSGLFDNVIATITNVQYTKEPPDNYQAEGNPIFANLSLLVDGDAPEEERKASQSYSLGASAGDNFSISADGYGLIPTSDDAQVRKDSKWGTLMASFKNEGVPKPVLQAGDASKFIGLKGLFKRVNDKERNFSEDKRTRPGSKSKFPPQTLILAKLHAMPGEKAAGGKTNGKVTDATAAPAAAEASGDLDSDTLPFLEAALKSAGKPLQRGQITLAVSKAAMGNASRAVYAKRAAEEEYLTKLAEAGLVTYAPAEKGQPVSLAA